MLGLGLEPMHAGAYNSFGFRFLGFRVCNNTTNDRLNVIEIMIVMLGLYNS